MKLAITEIKILPRQRIDIGDLSDLDSMADSAVAQICPIIVDETNTLVDGFRRLTKAKELGWTEIDVAKKGQLTELQKQKMEFLADVGRKDRTWQERCITVNKLHKMLVREKAEEGERWTYEQMSGFTGEATGTISYMISVATCLNALPRDEEMWTRENYTQAIDLLRERAEKEAAAELERRRLLMPKPTTLAIKELSGSIDVEALPSKPQVLIPTRPLTLFDRAQIYNKAYEHLGPPNTPLYYSNRNNREFLTAFWFVGGANISDFYGAYQIEYLERITSLFPDIKGKQDVIHLFSGSIPNSPNYSVVGLRDANNTPDIECDAHNLSSVLLFHPKLIYADPPYSVEDSEHYANSMVNREKVMSECANILQPNGFLVWIDQALPIFSNNDLQFVGAIGYIRSTGNRFRVVSIFRKPLLCQTTTPSSSQGATDSNSKSNPES